jgi:hypothetical protein
VTGEEFPSPPYLSELTKGAEMSRRTPKLASAILTIALVHVTAGPASAQAAPDESAHWITFLSHRSGYSLLYRMRPDESETKAIFGGAIPNVPVVSEGVALYREPHWTRLSPNCKYFASWVYEKGEPYSAWKGSARAMLIVGDLEGTWTRVLNPVCHEEFAWSPDSQRLALSIFSGDREKGTLRSSLRSTQIVTCGIDGSNETVVLEQPGILAVLDWSPDGKRLLLSRRYLDSKPTRSSDLFELDLSQKECLPYLIEGSRQVNVSEARYSPSGDKISLLYTDQENRYAPNEVAGELGKLRMMRLLAKLAVMSRDGKNMTTIADYPDGMRGPICWSPDAESILVSRYLPKDDKREKFDAEHGLAIWAIQADGNGARFLTTGWSPDWRSP